MYEARFGVAALPPDVRKGFAFPLTAEEGERLRLEL